MPTVSGSAISVSARVCSSRHAWNGHLGAFTGHGYAGILAVPYLKVQVREGGRAARRGPSFDRMRLR